MQVICHNTICFVLSQVRNGHIKRITDNDIQSLVLEIVGVNVRFVCYGIFLVTYHEFVYCYISDTCFSCINLLFVNMELMKYVLYSTTYITCPADPKKTLGIKLPYLVMIVKNLNKYFTFEVQVMV